ncbi:toll-like receptor 2 [Heteronotia binoei]|uniref:toll-like receptor 2 n=1 Tax=Heteronotia binoei TaxID=13085 RepID=UPI002930ECE5|nr:toll-like receptor 2 [Heteronotia binoei]
MPPLTVLWLALLLVIVGLENKSEASLCTITEDKLKASCQGRSLFSVPQGLPITLQVLDLSYNKIRKINSADFSSFTQLKDLDLSFNHIMFIANDSFSSNIFLEQLNLFNNSLGEIPSQALKPLKHLRVLSMSNNLYPRSMLDGVFSTLKKLEVLSMGGPAVQTVGSQDFLSIKEIPLKKFALKTAFNLLEYQTGAFSKLNTTALWCDISLDQNTKALPLILQDLHGKPLRYLRFRKLFEFMYYMATTDLFSGLAELEAEELVFFRGKFNENLLRLALLNVQKSHIRDLSFIAIDFARSPEWKPPEAGIANLTLCHLVLQDINNPDILRFDWTFTWFAGVTYLYILNVNFNYVPCDAWGEMRNVVALNISRNRLKNDNIYNQACTGRDTLPKVEDFNVTHNELTSLKTVADLTSSWARLSKLDLSRNLIGGLNELPCTWTPSLVWLSLAYNAVTMEIFNCLPITLHFLDMSHSGLEALNKGYFELAVDLKELLLSGNKIKYIPTKWKCPNLRTLHVDGNSFGAINKGSFGNMPFLAYLKAGNNPYHCVCDLYGFLQETLRDGKLTLLDWPKGWTCFHPEPLRHTSVAAYAPRVTECDVTVVVAIAVSITATVAIVCMVLCWKFDIPWYLKATFRIVRSKYRASHSQPSKPFAYHAFISYSCSDAEWVRHELLQRLEASTPPYRVCIHERDFTPGRWIIDNIIENIENSRKVIFVLSRNFVDSEWCNYELYFAHQRAVGLGFEDVVLVVKEPIDLQALPNKFCKLRKMLSTKTYLEWPLEPSRQPFFWLQLKSVLGKAEMVNIVDPGNVDPNNLVLNDIELISDEVTDSTFELNDLSEENVTVDTEIS